MPPPSLPNASWRQVRGVVEPMGPPRMDMLGLAGSLIERDDRWLTTSWPDCRLDGQWGPARWPGSIHPDPGGRSIQEVGPEGDGGVLVAFGRWHRVAELVVEVVDQIGAVMNDVRLVHRQHGRTGAVWISQQVPV